jgi:hypothetical protein
LSRKRPGAANPKFAWSWCKAVSEFRIQSRTDNFDGLVCVLDLKFPDVAAIDVMGTSNPPHQ